MRIYFSEQRAVHAPVAFVSRGQITASPGVPARAKALLDAAREAKQQALRLFQQQGARLNAERLADQLQTSA